MHLRIEAEVAKHEWRPFRDSVKKHPQTTSYASGAPPRPPALVHVLLQGIYPLGHMSYTSGDHASALQGPVQHHVQQSQATEGMLVIGNMDHNQLILRCQPNTWMAVEGDYYVQGHTASCDAPNPGDGRECSRLHCSSLLRGGICWALLW